MSKKILFLLMTVMVAYLHGLAQSTVKLSGKVINSRNEPVPGATVTIEGTNKKAAADVEGRFTIQLETGKKYVLLVSSAGYSTKSIEDVTVTADENANNISVVLENKSELGEVVVRSSVKKETTSALINLQRNNIAVSSGIAADLIRRTPDRTTGEVLKRVSGTSIQDNKFVIVRGLSDRYNAAFINNSQLPSSEPDRKAFSFDVIPANMIDNIVINKTATPELTGEFAGGLIQVQTKDIPSKKFLSIGLQWGYNTNSTFKDFYSNPRTNTDWLGWDDGTRRFPSGFPGSRQEYGNLPTSQQIEKSKLFQDDVYRQVKTTALPVQQYNISYGSVKNLKNNAKLGLIASVTYRNAMLKYTVDRSMSERENQTSFDYTDLQNKYQVNLGAMVNLTYSQANHKISWKTMYNRFYEDNYYTRSGYNNSRNQDINFYSSILNQRNFVSTQLEGDHNLNVAKAKFRWNAGYALVTRTQPDLRTQQYTQASENAPVVLDPDDSRRFWSDLYDHTVTVSGAFTLPFEMFGGQKQNLKFGGGTVLRFRDFKARIFRVTEASSQFDDNISQLPFDQIFNRDNFSQTGYVYDEFTNNSDKYFGVSAINSGFAMFDNKLSEKVRLIWGARVEFFEQFLDSKNLSAEKVTQDTEKWDVLPSVNFTYSPTTKSNLRVAASQTVARPEFREIAPFQFFDYESNYGIVGNTDLKRTKILNLDLRYEIYPAAGEVFSLGGFYKQFDNPIEFRLNPGSTPERRLYEYANADKADTYGAEFEFRKNLGFISKSSNFMNNMVGFGNVTYLISDVSFTDATSSSQTINANRPIQGQSPYILNGGLQYTSEKYFNMTLVYNRIGPRLALVGNTEIADVYERPRNLLDFQIAKRVMKKQGEVKLTFSDILNNKIYLYENTSGGKEYSSKDKMFSSYKPGTTISLGFTYDFSFDKKK